MCRITVISPLQNEAFIYFKPQERELCAVHLYAFVAPVLSAEWAWNKMLIIPRPENSFGISYFERHFHGRDLIILPVAVKVEK